MAGEGLKEEETFATTICDNSKFRMNNLGELLFPSLFNFHLVTTEEVYSCGEG